MFSYEKVLVAIDLGEYSGDLIERALSISGDPSKVHIAFVQQRMESVYVGDGPMSSALTEVSTLERRLETDLRERLKGWAESEEVPVEQVHYLNGKPAKELRRFAETHSFDLLVIGSHSRKGLQRLLGSTANAVLQSAPCDVLAVRA